MTQEEKAEDEVAEENIVKAFHEFYKLWILEYDEEDKTDVKDMNTATKAFLLCLEKALPLNR